MQHQLRLVIKDNATARRGCYTRRSSSISKTAAALQNHPNRSLCAKCWDMLSKSTSTRRCSPTDTGIRTTYFFILGQPIFFILGQPIYFILGRPIYFIFRPTYFFILGRPILFILGRPILFILGRPISFILGRPIIFILG